MEREVNVNALDVMIRRSVALRTKKLGKFVKSPLLSSVPWLRRDALPRHPDERYVHVGIDGAERTQLTQYDPFANLALMRLRPHDVMRIESCIGVPPCHSLRVVEVSQKA